LSLGHRAYIAVLAAERHSPWAAFSTFIKSVRAVSGRVGKLLCNRTALKRRAISKMKLLLLLLLL